MRRLAALAAGRLACYLERYGYLEPNALPEPDSCLKQQKTAALVGQYAGILPFGLKEEELEELYTGFLTELFAEPETAEAEEAAGTSETASEGYQSQNLRGQKLQSQILSDQSLQRQHLQRLLLLLKPADLPGKIAWVCLELAVLSYMEPQIGELFEAICGDSTGRAGSGGATIELAGRLVCDKEASSEYFQELREAYSRIELLLQAEYPAKGFLRTPLQADDRLIDWLSGGEDLTLLSPGFLSWYSPTSGLEASTVSKASASSEAATVSEASAWIEPAFRTATVPIFRSEQFGQLVSQFQGFVSSRLYQNAVSSQPVTLLLTGEPCSGRKFLLKRFADRFGFRLLMVEAAFLGDLNSLLQQLRKLLRELLFAPVLLCITDIPKRPDTISQLLVLTREYTALQERLERLAVSTSLVQYPLLLSGASGIKAAPALGLPVIARELTLPSREESAAAWDYFAGCYLGKDILQSRDLAGKMRLPIGRIEQVVKRLAALPAEEARQSRTIFRCCYELLDDGRYDNIKRVETQYTYEDLKLEESQKSIIRDICAQVEYRRKVMDEWNLKSRYSYGTCVSALFTGPPGTGKTMAVHVMAGILGLELFRVDLSQLVDKYIGETEKRLEEVFQKAERSNMILFFDEADSIIGKRSEVKESKDKYANTEVSYLLQRMEEFDGIVILSSNYSQNIDAAFMRRIRFTIHFPIPDAATRKEIWQSSFSAEVPRKDLDFDYLSRQFEFTGGQIKNVVWNAVFFAAAEESPVEMRHLIRAIQLELTKDKKVSFQEVLGEYAHLLYLPG